MKVYTISTITNSSIAANALGTAQFSDVFPGEWGGQPVMAARVEYSWTGMAGGDGTSVLTVRGHTLPANPASVPSAGAAAVNMRTRIGSSAAAFSTTGSPSTGMAGAAPAAAGEYCDLAQTTEATGGSLVPFPKWWTVRLSNGGTAWTGGTLTINRVLLYV